MSSSPQSTADFNQGNGEEKDDRGVNLPSAPEIKVEVQDPHEVSQHYFKLLQKAISHESPQQQQLPSQSVEPASGINNEEQELSPLMSEPIVTAQTGEPQQHQREADTCQENRPLVPSTVDGGAAADDDIDAELTQLRLEVETFSDQLETDTCIDEDPLLKENPQKQVTDNADTSGNCAEGVGSCSPVQKLPNAIEVEDLVANQSKIAATENVAEEMDATADCSNTADDITRDNECESGNVDDATGPIKVTNGNTAKKHATKADMESHYDSETEDDESAAAAAPPANGTGVNAATPTSLIVSSRARSSSRKAARRARTQISTQVTGDGASNDEGGSDYEPTADDVTITKVTADDVTITKVTSPSVSSSHVTNSKKRKLTPARASAKEPAAVIISDKKAPRHCKCCDNKFSSRDEFKHHVLVILGPTSKFVMFKCPDCCRCVDSIAALNKHRTKKHNYRPPAPPPPPPPPKPMVKPAQLSAKMSNSVVKPPPPNVKMVCTICNETFPDRETLSTHLDAHSFLRDLNMGNGKAISNGQKTTSQQQQKPPNNSKTTSQQHQPKNHKTTFKQQQPNSRNTTTHQQSNNHITTSQRRSDDVIMIDQSEVNSMRLPQGGYACRWCDKKYKGRLCLSKHLLTCTETSPSLVCKQCNRRFQQAENLRKHMLLHANTRPFKCTECDKAFTAREHLSVHMKAEHNLDPPRHQCDQCGKIFRDAQHLRRHALRHSDMRPFACERCPRRFKARADLRVHEGVHESVRKFKCHECDRSYVKPSHLQEHLKSHVAERNRDICQYCDKPFDDQEALKSHEASHTENKPYRCQYCTAETFADVTERDQHEFTHTTERPHKCQLCDLAYIRRSSLYTHLLSHKTQFECAKCDKTFKNVYSLRKHNTIHEGVKEFSCEICGKQFREARNLRVHQMTHTGERPYVCNICDKRFITAGELRLHKRVHTGEKPHNCEYCNMAFTQKGNLLRHLCRHTGERPLTCHICGKGYIEKEELKAHIMNHEGIKPHKCQQCGVGFVRHHHLNKHMRTHTGLKPYCCEFCGKAFAERFNMLMHRVIHTGIKPHPCPFCSEGFIRKAQLRKHVEETHPDQQLPNRPAFYVDREKQRLEREALKAQGKLLAEQQAAAAAAATNAVAAKMFVANQQTEPSASQPEVETKSEHNVVEAVLTAATAERAVTAVPPPFLPEVPDLNQSAYTTGQFPAAASMLQQFSAANSASMLHVNTTEGLLSRLNELQNNQAFSQHNYYPL